MKRALLFIPFICVFYSTIYSTNYIVVGSGNSAINGTYVENGTYNDKPLYQKAGTNYYIVYDYGYWTISMYEDMMGYMSMHTVNSSANTPPYTGWSGNPAPILTDDIPTLIYDKDYFYESTANDGSIVNSIIIKHNNYNNATFSGSDGDNFVAGGKVSITNLPSGLTAVLTRNNSLQLTLSITGNAVNHTTDNNISNLTITFQNTAFSDNNASQYIGYLKNNIKIYFYNDSGANLLQNPGAEFDYDSWIKTNAGSGWTIINDAPSAHSGSKYWKSSYNDNILEQTVDLLTAGYSAAYLDEIPMIITGVYVLPGHTNGSPGHMTIMIQLLDSGENVIYTYYIANEEDVPDLYTWIHKTGTIAGYPTGLRKLKMTLVGNSFVGWAGQYGPSFDDSYLQINEPLPVELTSFSAIVVDNQISLNWNTATEINNYGFEIERSFNNTANYECLAFVAGNGNSNSSHNYTFIDNNTQSGKYYYRLKQIDTDGNFTYSKDVEIDVNSTLSSFNLYQNYPNPFNPNTTIKYSIPAAGLVTLKVYDVLGTELVTLINENKNPGTYQANFNASFLSSGIYFYKLTAGAFCQTKKLILIK